MSRKQQNMPMRKEGQRRSPRICALDAWKTQRPTLVGDPNSTSTSTSTSNLRVMKGHSRNNGRGPASRTRGRKKRKLRPLEDVAFCSGSSNAKQGGDYDMQGCEQANQEDHPINNGQPVVQNEDTPKHEVHSTYTDQAPIMSSALWMPEKRVLELILDILQRRDTHEIFAEPVDPNEVEDYYEIIKEPMDFGTMRAKLHEGMYQSLQQFEHDVFLISSNAMHFNSSGTIYFRQARAIHELSKKVFHVLKSDPENFELEFSETRRRTGRRPQGESRVSFNSLSPKLPTIMRSNSMPINASSKTSQCSTRGSSNPKRTIQGDLGCFGAATRINARDHEVLSGDRDGRKFSDCEADRRCTYKPWASSLSNETIYSKWKPLMHVNQQEIGYRESLMMFAKDLGPTAQMVAKRKLNGWSADGPNQASSFNCFFQAPKCQIPVVSTSTQQEPTSLNTVTTPQMSHNLVDRLHGCPSGLDNTNDRMDSGDADKGKNSYTGDKMIFCRALVGEVASSSDGKSIHGAPSREVHSSYGINGLGFSGSDKVHQNQSTGIQLNSFSSIAEFKNTSNKSTNRALHHLHGNMDNEVHSSEPASQHSQSNLLEFRLKNNCSISSSQPPQTLGFSSFCQTKSSMHNLSLQYLTSENQDSAAQDTSHGVSSSSETHQALMKQNQPMPVVSQYIFDLPYLKTRLDQINSTGQDRLPQRSSRMEGPFVDKTSYWRAWTCTRQADLSSQPCNDNQQGCSLDSQHQQAKDLALQL